MPDRTLTRRDLAAVGAPWSLVDTAHADDVGDLWAQIVGTGHPVLWRIAGGERVEGWCCTGPWRVREAVEGDALVICGLTGWRSLERGAFNLVRAEVARIVAHLAPEGSREALAYLDLFLESGDPYAAGSAAICAGAAFGSIDCPDTDDEYIAADAILQAVDGSLGATVAEVERIPVERRCDPQRPHALTDTRAVILRALGVRL